MRTQLQNTRGTKSRFFHSFPVPACFWPVLIQNSTNVWRFAVKNPFALTLAAWLLGFLTESQLVTPADDSLRDKLVYLVCFSLSPGVRSQVTKLEFRLLIGPKQHRSNLAFYMHVHEIISENKESRCGNKGTVPRECGHNCQLERNIGSISIMRSEPPSKSHLLTGSS